MIETSTEINEIATACAKVQAELENVAKGGVNPHFRTKYATLADVLDEVRGKYAAAGIVIWQAPINGEGSNIGVVTRLAHSSGQWIQSTLYVAPSKFDAQGAGSVITYLRRYALMAMTGVSADDDDGDAAVAKPEPPEHARTVTDTSALRAARDRILADIDAAETPQAIDKVIGGSTVDLALIQHSYSKTYDGIMAKATARRNELLSGDVR